MKHHRLLLALLIISAIISCGEKEETPVPELPLPPLDYSDYLENQREFSIDEAPDSVFETGELTRYYEIDLEGRILAISNPENFDDINIAFSNEPAFIDSALIEDRVTLQSLAGDWIDNQEAFWKFVKVEGQPTRLALNYRPSDPTSVGRNFINGGTVLTQPGNQFFDRHLSYVYYEIIDQGEGFADRRDLVIYTPVNLGIFKARGMNFGDQIDGYVVYRFNMGFD